MHLLGNAPVVTCIFLEMLQSLLNTKEKELTHPPVAAATTD
jgi:hypothetical protein